MALPFLSIINAWNLLGFTITLLTSTIFRDYLSKIRINTKVNNVLSSAKLQAVAMIMK